jgi:hypothetical protein
MMSTKGEIADSRFISWSTPEFAWKIEYPPEVMDQIRAYACDSLLKLSHAGRDVGGVMYGSRSDGVIRIVTWRRIMCEYAEGDALQLSHRDRMNLAVEFEAARSNPELQDLRPVGWFVSHPHGSVSMTASDLVNFSNFFPESAQFTGDSSHQFRPRRGRVFSAGIRWQRASRGESQRVCDRAD